MILARIVFGGWLAWEDALTKLKIKLRKNTPRTLKFALTIAGLDEYLL